MKTKYIFLLLFVLSITKQNSYAQTYTPFPDSNAVWNILELTMGYPSDTTKSQTKLYGLINDTIINTVKYNKLYFNDGLMDSTIEVSSSNTSYLCAIRQDTLLKKVYFIPKDSINELILYDFGINPSDTFYVYNEIGNKVKAWCTGAGLFFISGKIRNKFTIKTDNISFYGSHVWVEGVGNMRGLFETFNDFSSNKAVMCLNVNDSLYYKFDGNMIWGISIDTSVFKLCYNNGLIITDNFIIENSKNKVIIFPNPLTYLTFVSLPENLKLNNIIIDIFDVQGRIIKEFHTINNHQLILSRAEFKAVGVYFIRIKSDNYLKIIKLLVQ